MSLDHIGELPEVREYEAGEVLKHEWNGVNASGEEDHFEIQLVAKSSADAALAAADREVGRLKEGYIRILQCNNYPLTIMATDVETGEVGPHVVDGNNAADILTIICDVFPDFGSWAERGAP